MKADSDHCREVSVRRLDLEQKRFELAPLPRLCQGEYKQSQHDQWCEISTPGAASQPVPGRHPLTMGCERRGGDRLEKGPLPGAAR